jgi:hypothetical protein
MLVKLTALQDGSPVWVNPEHVTFIAVVNDKTQLGLDIPVNTYNNVVNTGDLDQKLTVVPGQLFWLAESPTDAAIALNAAELKFNKDSLVD